MEFKSLPNNEKPRERLKLYGTQNLSNEELLQIIIKSGNRKYSVKDLSCNILTSIKDITSLKNIKLSTLTKVEGITEIKALELLASLELGKRVYKDIGIEKIIDCTSPSNIIEYFYNILSDEKQEKFYVLYLDNKKKYIAKKLLFQGSINTSVVHPREIFKEAYLLSSSFIICIHNHPSGDPTPSKEDLVVTKKINEISLLHSLPLIDHIIIGKNAYYSFYEDGKI